MHEEQHDFLAYECTKKLESKYTSNLQPLDHKSSKLIIPQTSVLQNTAGEFNGTKRKMGRQGTDVINTAREYKQMNCEKLQRFVWVGVRVRVRVGAKVKVGVKKKNYC